MHMPLLSRDQIDSLHDIGKMDDGTAVNVITKKIYIELTRKPPKKPADKTIQLANAVSRGIDGIDDAIVKSVTGFDYRRWDNLRRKLQTMKGNLDEIISAEDPIKITIASDADESSYPPGSDDWIDEVEQQMKLAAVRALLSRRG